MFPRLFRIGPMAITELILGVVGISSLILSQVWSCISYTFLHLTLQIFLAEVIIGLRFIKRNKKLRVNYVSKLVFGSQKNLLFRIVWNSINIGAVILILTVWMIRQGFILSSHQISNSQKQFTLYPLCYFSDLQNHPQSHSDFGMVADFLYAFSIFINLFLITLTIRELYLYHQNINKNRQYARKNSIQKSESLLDCKVIEESLISENLIDQKEDSLECGICLRKFQHEKYIKLRCSHLFHEECINLWLKVKDTCPYRCD